jgi:hypothetical protein
MRRIILAMMVMGLLVAFAATPAFAFHHGSIPARECANDNAGSPSNDNGMAKEKLSKQDRGGEAAGPLPLPPVGTPGAGQGQGGENCQNAPTPVL